MLAIALALAASVIASPTAQPAETTPPPLTLAQAVEQARGQSPVRAGAAALAEGAESAARLAGRLPNPLIDVRAENLTPRDPLAPDRDVFAVLSQPIELGGKRGTRKELASADSGVSSLMLRTIERQIALDTVRAYMRAIRARGVLANLTMQRDGVNTLVTTMRRRVEEGYAPESDLLRFEAEAARMAAEMTRTEIELSRALFDLGSLVGTGTPLEASQRVAP